MNQICKVLGKYDPHAKQCIHTHSSTMSVTKQRPRTFGIRRGFFEAYSHSLLIFRSFGSSTCQNMLEKFQHYNKGKRIKLKKELLSIMLSIT